MKRETNASIVVDLHRTMRGGEHIKSERRRCRVTKSRIYVGDEFFRRETGHRVSAFHPLASTRIEIQLDTLELDD